MSVLSGLFVLAAGAKEVTAPRLDSAPEAWELFLIAVLVGAFAIACYLLERKSERRWLKPGLAVLRALLLLIAIVILCRPLLSRELHEEKLGQVAVAIDVSRSMDFEDREKDDALRGRIAGALDVSPERLREMTRLERVKAALRKDNGAFLRKLAEKNRLRVYTFDSTRNRIAEVDKIDPDAELPEAGASDALAKVEGLAAEGQSTALGDSLQRIVGDLRNERVAGLVLITDGRNNGGSTSPVAQAGRLGRKGVKVYAVGVGDPEPPRDLILDDFRAPDVTLAGDVLAGSLVVRAQGYAERREVRVTVLIDGVKVAEETGEVGGDKPLWDFHFTTKVTRPGEHMLEARVEPDPDELTAENNVAKRRVRVIDERIKVLYVEGYPRWEYRYLKNALVRDRHMEVQCLLISADPGVQESSRGVPPLRELPSHEELLKYHVIIIGDVKPDDRLRSGARVFREGALETIREAVKERGAGFLMLSGAVGAPRLYAKTPIADILPIEIDESAFVQNNFKRAYRPKLTREGRESPLMRLEADDAFNRELWDGRLQGLYWYSQVKRAKPQAHVLSVHPTAQNAKGKPFPLMAWHRYGAGTVYWLGIDETWRWRAEVGDKYPYRFYGQILRFLSLQSFSRSKRFYITTDKTDYSVGDEVRIRAEVRDEQARQNHSAESKQPILADLPNGDTQTIVLSGIEGEPGKFEGTYKPVQTGSYKLYVEAGDRFGVDEIASRVFEVRLPRLEAQDRRMDKEGLERIASESGGKFLRLDELAAIPDELSSLSEPIRLRKEEEELWNRPWVFGLFFVLILCEWLGRRAAKLL